MVEEVMAEEGMPEEGMPDKAGIYELTKTLKSGRRQRYALALPRGYDVKQPVPLVMALHYGGKVTPWYGRHYLDKLPEPALRELGAIIIAPDSPGMGWTNPESEAVVLELLEHIKDRYSIDEKRKLITGYSMGGIGTWYIVSRHPKLFSAAVPVSSSIHPLVLESLRGVPLYVIHSTGDEIFPVALVKEMAQSLKQSGIDLHLEIVENISHHHTERFIPPLKKAIPWIKQQWKIGSR